MGTTLLYFLWNADPEMFIIPGIDWPVRWYGLLFAVAFIGSQFVMNKVYRTELRPQKDLDTLTLYIIVGTVVGARLGHMLFYDFKALVENPLDVFKIWEGGLASHGSAIGILTAMWLYCRKTKENWLWIFDRLVIVVALSAMCIRGGNLMNSEIIGKPTSASYGFVFLNPLDQSIKQSLTNIDKVDYKFLGKDTIVNRHTVSLLEVNVKTSSVVPKDSILKVASEIAWYSSNTRPDDKHIFIAPDKLMLENQEASNSFTFQVYAIPRHAAQLYEGIFGFILFILFFWLWLKKRDKFPQGFMFGLFCVLLFTERFFDEMLKENQVAFEDSMKLNMGQWLSIPFVLIGIAFMVWSKKRNVFHKLPE
jgi:phosphatidylglycerol:prolipoprotein diacylglycerol transferase